MKKRDRIYQAVEKVPCCHPEPCPELVSRVGSGSDNIAILLDAETSSDLMIEKR